MGAIRAKILYANPKFDFLGVCDINLSAAKKLADVYSVRHWLSALPHAFGLESNRMNLLRRQLEPDCSRENSKHFVRVKNFVLPFSFLTQSIAI